MSSFGLSSESQKFVASAQAVFPTSGETIAFAALGDRCDFCCVLRAIPFLLSV